jgi:hypothetical protein
LFGFLYGFVGFMGFMALLAYTEQNYYSVSLLLHIYISVCIIVIVLQSIALLQHITLLMIATNLYTFK